MTLLPPLSSTYIDTWSFLDTLILVNGRPNGKTGATLELTAAIDCCTSLLTSPLAAAEAAELATAFSALADPVRLQVLSILAAADAGEVCVCDFVEPLGKSQPTVSHHLKVLSDAGIVHGECRSKWVYYSLDRARLAALRGAIDS